MADAWDYGPGNIDDPGSWMGSWEPESSGSAWGALGKVAESFLTTGIPRIIDAKANMIRAENTRPVMYRNGVPYYIDPDAYRYGYASPLGGAFGGAFGGNSTLLLILGGVALFLLAKD